MIVPVDYRFEEDVTTEQAEPRRKAGLGGEKGKSEVSEHGPDPEESSQGNRPKREAARKAMDALKKGADATRGRGCRRGRVYQRAGIRN